MYNILLILALASFFILVTTLLLFSISFIAASSKEDQEECERIKANYDSEKFPYYWLKYKGIDDALEAYLDFTGQTNLKGGVLDG